MPSQSDLPQTVLSVRDLSVWTPQGETLAGRGIKPAISFELKSGECLLLKGENGTGKSTLISAILGTYPHKEGRVEIRVKESELAFLPQLGNVRFFLPMTLSDIMGLGTEEGMSQEAALKVGLLSPSSLDLAWNTASGGERQRTLITRSVLAKPKLFILDEPFNHLDSASKKRVVVVLRDLLDQGCALVLISHEQSLEGLAIKHTIELGSGSER